MRLYSLNLPGNLHQMADLVQRWDDDYRANLGYKTEGDMDARGIHTFAAGLKHAEYSGSCSHAIAMFALTASQAAYLREKGWL